MVRGVSYIFPRSFIIFFTRTTFHEFTKNCMKIYEHKNNFFFDQSYLAMKGKKKKEKDETYKLNSYGS